MRYEFERGGNVVASVLWEGPAQVTVEVSDETVKADFDRFFESEITYLGSGMDDTDVLQTRRRDWTPWEFERSCRNLAHRIGATVKRVETGPVEDRPGEEVWAR